MERHTYDQAYCLFLYNPINLYAVNKAVEFVPYVTENLILTKTGVTAEPWSVRKQKAAVHEQCAYFGFHRSAEPPRAGDGFQRPLRFSF